jgi:hypothetical protein
MGKRKGKKKKANRAQPAGASSQLLSTNLPPPLPDQMPANDQFALYKPQLVEWDITERFYESIFYICL